jgi:hypothetical protein
MRIFERLKYDLLTIDTYIHYSPKDSWYLITYFVGNHELLLAEVAYQTFHEIAKLTSNVRIFNPATSKFEYMGKQCKCFTTKNGLRIMAFGMLFDMTREPLPSQPFC